MEDSPLVITRPASGSMLSPANRAFIAQWSDLRKSSGKRPSYTQFNLNTLPQFPGTLRIFHPLPDGDFYCSHSGVASAESKALDLTGHNHSKIFHKFATEFATCFSATLESGEPILALHGNGGIGHGWEHAIVPVESPLGRIIIASVIRVAWSGDLISSILRSMPGAIVAHSSVDRDRRIFPAQASITSGETADAAQSHDCASSLNDTDFVLAYIDIDALRRATDDLARRRSELINLTADLDRQEQQLSMLKQQVDQARASFDSEVSERRRLEVELRRLAETDDLTGHLNRRAFFRQLETEISRSKRYGHPPTLLYLDIDRFKSINDTHGHAAGDAVIRTVLQRIVSVLRNSVDLVGRLGGDEFAILLPETALQGARVAAERIRLIISDVPLGTPNASIPVTISIGIAAWNDAVDVTGDTESLENWIARADEALYQAKHNGRNTISYTNSHDQRRLAPDVSRNGAA